MEKVIAEMILRTVIEYLIKYVIIMNDNQFVRKYRNSRDLKDFISTGPILKRPTTTSFAWVCRAYWIHDISNIHVLFAMFWYDEAPLIMNLAEKFTELLENM